MVPNVPNLLPDIPHPDTRGMREKGGGLREGERERGTETESVNKEKRDSERGIE